MSENFDEDDNDDGGSDMLGRVLWALLICAALVTLWVLL